MGTQLVVASHNNSSTLIVAQATTAGKKRIYWVTLDMSHVVTFPWKAHLLETALAVGAYAEENRMGEGARGQEKKNGGANPAR